MSQDTDNVPATHRTEAATGVFYEKYAKPVVERNRTFVLFIMALVACISLSWAIVLLIPRHTDVPFIVEVNPDTGKPINQPIAVTQDFTPSHLEIQYFASVWLRDLFTINPALSMRYITNDYMETIGEGTKQIKAWEKEHQPIAKMQANPGFHSTAAILSTSFMGGRNLFVRVQQTMYYQHKPTTVRVWNCTVSYALIPPQTVDQAYQNPIGFHVQEFVCTRSLSNHP